MIDACDYIDWDERDFGDASESAAVNECDNCHRTCERLSHIPEWDFMACDDCMDECAAILEQEREDAARLENCEHSRILIEEHEDPDDECVRVFEEITCRDCGVELVERKGELVARKRRAA